MVCRRSRKRSCARYKFIITRASKHAAGFLARSRRFLFGSLSSHSFFPPPRSCLSTYLPARYLPVPLPSPASRDAHRLSIKNFIIRSRSSFVFQFDFYRAVPGKRQVRNVARSFPPSQPPDTSSTFFSATPVVPSPCPDI